MLTVDVEVEAAIQSPVMVMGCIFGWTMGSVLQTKVDEVVILVLLVGHLVAPLLHGLHVVDDDAGLGHLPHGGSDEGPGLGQTQAVGDLDRRCIIGRAPTLLLSHWSRASLW